MKHTMHWLIGAMAAIGLSACSGSLLGNTPTPDALYTLTALRPASPVAETLPFTLKVALPQVAPGLDTARIAVKETPNHITYYTGSAWAAPLPGLTQAFFSDAFTKIGAFRVTGTDTDGMRSNLTLLLTIHESHVEPAGDTPSVRLRLTGTLVGSTSREPLISVGVEKTLKAERNQMSAIIQAFDQAYNLVAQELVDRLVPAAKEEELSQRK